MRHSFKQSTYKSKTFKMKLMQATRKLKLSQLSDKSMNFIPNSHKKT